MSRKSRSRRELNQRNKSLDKQPTFVDLRGVLPRRWRTQIVAGVVAFALLIGGVTFAHWREEQAPPKTLASRSSALPPKQPNPPMRGEVPNDPFADLPETLNSLPPTDAGYNAHSGGLPPGALPAGVSLPGLMPAAGAPPMVGINSGMSSANSMMPGAMTMQQGYGVADGVRQGFTGKEFDGETGLNYYGARYYSPTQGRFTSVDPENADADPAYPQSWNGYTYARNNPVLYTDPDGRSVRVCDNAGKCDTISDADANNGLFSKAWQKKTGHTVKNGKVYLDGEQVATYENLGIDGAPFSPALMQAGNRPYGTATLQFGLAGVAGGAALYGLGAVGTGSGLTTLGLGAATSETAATSTTVTIAGRTITTIGQGLKNVRSIGSGRLGSYLRGNTELPGGDQAARAVFRQLTGRDPVGSFERVVQGGKDVVYRASSNSGVSKVEIVDHAQRFLEKISFK